MTRVVTIFCTTKFSRFFNQLLLFPLCLKTSGNVSVPFFFFNQGKKEEVENSLFWWYHTGHFRLAGKYSSVDQVKAECEFLLLDVHGGQKAYQGRGWVGKGDRRLKPRNRCQPGRPRLPRTAASTIRCWDSVHPALCSDHSTTQLPSQLLCRTVTKTMSVAPPSIKVKAEQGYN